MEQDKNKTAVGCPCLGGSDALAEERPEELLRVPAVAPSYNGANLLIAADEEAYAYASFHEELIGGKLVLMGNAGKDASAYTRKLAEILTDNDIQSLTLVHLDKPEFSHMEKASEDALRMSGKVIPYNTVIVAVKNR